MVRKTLDAHIEITPASPEVNAHRWPSNQGSRMLAIWHEEMRMAAAEIAKEYDLSLADVHAALAYYHDHRQEIDKDIATRTLLSKR